LAGPKKSKIARTRSYWVVFPRTSSVAWLRTTGTGGTFVNRCRTGSSAASSGAARSAAGP
jgi:hypothetical protein